MLNLYRILQWPIAKPVARLLDLWVGTEAIPWFRERELGDILRHHAEVGESEVGRVEATGAVNFLALDDLLVRDEGEPLDAESVIALRIEHGRPLLPRVSRTPDDHSIRRLTASGKKWVIVVDGDGEPHFVVDTHKFLRDALFSDQEFAPESYFHRPTIVSDPHETVGSALGQFASSATAPVSELVRETLILVWTPDHKRIITGSDVLGCLLRGIARPAA